MVHGDDYTTGTIIASEGLGGGGNVFTGECVSVHTGGGGGYHNILPGTITNLRDAEFQLTHRLSSVYT